jgi:hypothetical protein
VSELERIVMVVYALTGYIVLSHLFFFFVINKLVNKVMAGSFFEYQDGKRHLKKPKEVTVTEEFVPQENMARMF